MHSLALSLFSLASSSLATVVTYNWELTWVTANPDGLQPRPVIGINGKWPLPPIEVDFGDNIVVKLKNSLGNETTGLHFHGQYQEGTPHMDGPSGVTQCSIPPGSSFTYSFTANPAGTYWYHSHEKGQYPDGFRGPLIVHDRKTEDYERYDKQYTLTLSDWYHGQMGGPNGLVNYYLSAANDAAGGAEPIPNSGLINDKKTETFDLQPGKKYLFRVIGMSALAAHFLEFEGHDMTVVAIDGVPVSSQKTKTIYMSAAQRYDVVIQALDKPTKNYAFIAQMDNDMFDTAQPDSVTIANGVLRYSPKFPAPAAMTTHGDGLDDMTLVPADGEKILDPPDVNIVTNLNFEDTFQLGSVKVQRAALGTSAYIGPKVPTLYTALTTGQDALNPNVYGDHVNPYVIQPGQIVQIVVNNLDEGSHPMHLHGRSAQVLHRSNTTWNNDTAGFPQVPMRRDTVKVPGLGSLVLRYKATSGIFLFHCHIEWHVEAGLSITLIEDPIGLQKSGLRIPADHLAACKVMGTPTQGNCAGDTRNPLDNSQCNSQFDPNPVGAFVTPQKRARMRRSKMRQLRP